MSSSREVRRVLVAGVRLPFGASEAQVEAALFSLLGASRDELIGWRILNRSLDARGAALPRSVHTLGAVVAPTVDASGFAPWPEEEPPPRPLGNLPGATPLVVGAGPAGLFAALRLCHYGFRPLIVERGKPIGERGRDVAAYWRTGVPDPDSNVQFGEGGAGAFSDGKLTSRSKDPRKGWVLDRLVEAGGDPSWRFDSRAHVGTDRLRPLILALRRELLGRGALYRFGTRVEDILLGEGRASGVATTAGDIPGGPVFLGVGHSARELYPSLGRSGVELAAKGFAVGVRVETPREAVDRDRHGRWATLSGLGAASYAVTAKAADRRGVYSFCMCPGGVVVPAGSEPDALVVNGMSGSRRSSRYSNSALVVEVRPEDFGSTPAGGVAFQRDMERRAWALAGERTIPAQTVADFLAGRVGGLPRSNCPWPLAASDLRECLPEFVHASLRECLPALISQVRPLAGGTLLGVETRTSSPVRIVRGEDMESVSLPGLYPIGEGAGYAGGIISSAIDGVRAVDAYVEKLRGNPG